MVEKYKGILPPGSIWFHFTGDEARAFVKTHPNIAAELPIDKPIDEIEDSEIQAVPGQVEIIETLIQEAGLTIKTLY